MKEVIRLCTCSFNGCFECLQWGQCRAFVKKVIGRVPDPVSTVISKKEFEELTQPEVFKELNFYICKEDEKGTTYIWTGTEWEEGCPHL